MITSLKQMTYLEKIAKEAFDKYGDDFYEALNAAECVVRDTEHFERGVQRVHAVLEGEL